MSKLTSEQAEEIKGLCQRSLHFLCTQFLGYKDWDKVHDDLEVFLKKPASKKALLLPRGHLKSTIVTIAFTIQQILKNPNVRILIGNQVWDISRKFLAEVKAQLESSQLKYLFGDFVSAKWNENEFIVRQRTKPLKEPTVLTTGVEAETTGGHFDVIILDDLIGLQNVNTPDSREKAKRYRRSMINLLEPGGILIEIGTRWHLDDTFSVIFEKESKYYDIMARQVIENGKIIFPRHFSKKFDDVKKTWISVPEENCMDYIEHLKASMPIDEFAAQYLNDPISSENQLFKPEFFQYWNKRPEGLYVSMAIDLAISQKTDADRTSIVVMGMDKDYRIYVLDYLVGRWSPHDIVSNIFSMQHKWKPFNVGMEVNGFQRTLKLAVEEEMRHRKQYFGVEEIRTGPEKSKENRIKSLEPFYRRGDVFHAYWMRNKDLEIELTTFPKGKHDDIIDSMAMCLPLLSPGTGVSKPSIQEGTFEWFERQAHNRGSRIFLNHGIY